MKVILLERIGRTGSIGDEVTVKDGFARNFLLPQGKALRATAANRQKFEGERANIEKRNEDQRSQVDLADPIKSVGVHAVALNLHAEVAVSINVNVARSEDEATRQSAGEDVTVTQYEEDEEGDFAAGQKDAQQDDRFDDEV